MVPAISAQMQLYILVLAVHISILHINVCGEQVWSQMTNTCITELLGKL